MTDVELDIAGIKIGKAALPEKAVKGRCWQAVFGRPSVVLTLFSLYAVLLYSNTFSASFHYDDYRSITKNSFVHWEVLSWENLRNLVVQEYDRPVSYISFAMNYYFGSLDVRGYHYVNTGIHVLSSFGLFLLLRIMLGSLCQDMGKGRKDFVAFASALLWLSSPMQTQAVTYIVQRMAALAAMFYIYALYFYLKGRSACGRRGQLFYALTIVSALLAFGSKQNSYTLPLCLILIEAIVVRRGSLKFLADKRLLAIFFFLSAGFAAICFWMYYFPLVTAPGPWLIYQIKIKFLSGMRVILFYMSQLILPIPSRMSLEHDFELSRSILDPPTTILAFLIIGGMISYALATFRKHPLFSFSVLWFFGNLAIESFTIPLTLVFEHRIYLSSMFFFLPFMISVDHILNLLKKRNMKLVVAFCLVIMVTSFSINTYARNSVWQDEYSLWDDVIKKSPNNINGYINLGNAYVRDGNNSEALDLYLAAKTLHPRSAVVRYSLGTIYFNLKVYDKAIDEFAYLGSMGYVGVDNERTISHYFSKIARNYYGHGRVRDAISVLEKALVYDPDEPALVYLKENMESGTLTFEEIMKN